MKKSVIKPEKKTMTIWQDTGDEVIQIHRISVIEKVLLKFVRTQRAHHGDDLITYKDLKCYRRRYFLSRVSILQ